MLPLIADENFSHRILRGLRRALGELDFVTAQAAGLAGSDDPEVLEWAASQGRILLTHDIRTIPMYAAERLGVGLRMPGVIVVPKQLGIGLAIADLRVVLACGTEADLENAILFLPLRASANE